jgi:hypothetical protein
LHLQIRTFVKWSLICYICYVAYNITATKVLYWNWNCAVEFLIFFWNIRTVTLIV